MDEIPAEKRDTVNTKVQFVNTVVSKMCGLVTDPKVIVENNLITNVAGESNNPSAAGRRL